MENEVNLLIKWIKTYVKKSGSSGVIIGNSGGKDSAVVIGLCARALKSENVLTVTLPCKSKKEDLEDANLVANTFKTKILEINLTSSYEKLCERIEKTLNKRLSNSSLINIIPRLRMTTIYAIAQQYNYLVVGTGNACERYIGYTTKWGDNACDINPIAEFSVSEVLEIGRIIGVPAKIINKVPNDGLGLGSDEEKLGITYNEIEKFMKLGKLKNTAKMDKIKELHNKTKHKRKQIPVFHRNYVDNC